MARRAAATAAAFALVPATAACFVAPPLTAKGLAARQLFLEAPAEAGLAHQRSAQRRAGANVAPLRAGVLATGQQLAAGVATNRRGLVAL